MTANDTIFALSSGAGRAAVAVIRLSGHAAGQALYRLAGELPEPRRAAVRSLRHPASREILDKSVILWLPAPRSFTGEDCAELQVHGGQAVVSAVMSALAALPDVRPAEAGEFTRRAFLNGKMDLVEVEGLADLLEARTATQRRQAFRQMSGEASSIFEAWRYELLLIRADMEAVVDFADEPGVADEAAPGIKRRIEALVTSMSEALAASAAAEVVRDGVRVVLAGHPNTGKSSLLNALARREAAIVSDVPGTTRDAIEVFLDVSGIPVTLTDTAGLRMHAVDKVEEEGIRRSRDHMARADVLIWVWSADVPGSEDVALASRPDLVVQNKEDLNSGLLRNESAEQSLKISARTGAGMAAFIESLASLLQLRYSSMESALFVSARQTKAAQNSIRYLNEALDHASSRLELAAEAVRQASDEIGRLTGRVDVEEWLGAIFSRFCIGK